MIQPHGDQWILLNLKVESLISPKGNPVTEDQACLLKGGEEIVISRQEKVRIASVRTVS